MTTRAVTALAAALLAVTACSSSDDPTGADTTASAAEATTDAPTTTDATVNTTAATSADTDAPTTTADTATTPTTDDPTTTAPPPATAAPTGSDATGTTTPGGEVDWYRVVTDLRATLDEIVVDPDPTRIPEVAVVGDPWDVEAGSAIRNSAERGERTVGLAPTRVVSAELESTFGDQPIEQTTAVIVKVVVEAPDLSEARIVDADGTTVFDLVNDAEPGSLSTSRWILVRTDDGWRISEIRT